MLTYLCVNKQIMTPKEKANELGNKFYRGSVFDYDKQEHLKEIELAKDGAKICVQVILDTIYEVPENKTKEFWTQVMVEIDLL